MINAYMNHDNSSENTEKYKTRIINKVEKINNNYSISKLLYKNNVLAVYKGYSTTTNEIIIIKSEIKNFNEKYKGIIDHERKILEILKNVSGVPKIIDFKNEPFSNSLVLNYLGKDLESIISNKKNFSIGLCAFIMCELIIILKNIHKYNIYHCDIKPSNFIFNMIENKIYLIDFSVAQKKGSINNKCMIGTPKFCSYYCHEIVGYSYRDDLISLGYVIVYFYYGYLPWQKKNLCSLKKYYNLKSIQQEKCNILLFLKNNNAPEEFVIYFNYCFSLNKKDEIDYNMIHLLFVRLIKSNNYTKENLKLDIQNETHVNENSNSIQVN